MFVRRNLKNGLKVIYEHIPGTKSVSIGVWAGVGSARENIEVNGASHYLEHMLFKGTKKRSARDIAEEMDLIGGQLNAFTSKETTCYYAKVIDSDLETAIDVLSDMYINSKIDPDDVELERGVILEEINMYEDSPEDVALDTLSKAAWGECGLGFSVSGEAETVEKIERKHLVDFAEKYYTAENTVVSVAGNFDEQKLMELLEKYFSPLRHGVKILPMEKAVFAPSKLERVKDIEQTHIALGFEGVSCQSGDMYSEAVLCNVLGGTMSSRLFQKIREEKGLCYSVYSASESFHSNGLFCIYAGLSPENADVVREMILSEIESLKKSGITDYELKKGKGQLRSSFILSLESIGAKMNTMGKCEVLGEKIKTCDEVLEGIEKVNSDSINCLIEKIFKNDYAESIVLGK